jgi:hypothetical protein
MTYIDEDAAIHTLRTIAQGRLATSLETTTLDSGLLGALAAAFGGSEGQPPTEGELAQAALDVLAEDATYAEPIEVLSRQSDRYPGSQRYFDPATITVGAAAILALQTRVKWKRDNTGKWSIEIEKKSASDAALKLLVGRLLSFLNK